MRLKAPSLAWLVAHDLRMSWRMLGDMFQSWTWLATALAIGSGLGCLHLIAGFIVLLHMKSPGTIGPGSLVTASAGVLFWMIAQGLLGATRALYERGHLEVLFSSPLPAWKAVSANAMRSSRMNSPACCRMCGSTKAGRRRASAPL